MKPRNEAFNDNIKAYMQSGAYEHKRREIQKEINQDKFSLDRTCFAKTPEENKQSKLDKKEFKKNGNTAEFRKLFADYIPAWGGGSSFTALRN